MARITEDELKKQIKADELSNAYMIYGEESYLKEYYVNKLKSKVVDAAFADFNFHQYDGKSASLDDILQDAEMVPMMSDRSFVLVHDYPLDKSTADVNTLKDFFCDLPDTCVLVFWFDSIEVDLKKSSKWKTIEKLFAAAGSSVDLQKRTETDLARLIVSSAKKRGCTIDSNMARYLISVVGDDIKTIFNELEKICAFVPSGTVTKEHIDTIAVKCLQARVYDLSKFITRGDSDGAYDVLNGLFAQKEEPIAILSVISSCYIDMYRAKCLKTANRPDSELSSLPQYRGRDWLVRNAVRDSRNVSLESLREAIDVLSATDELLKSTSINKNLLLEETVAKLLMLRNK